MAEMSLGGGVLFPALFAWTTIAVLVTMLLRRVLAVTGFYRLVWHRPLFDLALGIIILGATVALAPSLVGP